MLRLSFDEIKNTLISILVKNGFTETDAEKLAFVFTENNLVGVASHGTNRFVQFIKMVREGFIKPLAKSEKIQSFGAYEIWDANYSAGMLSSLEMTDRTCEIAGQYGIGCVALRNSNHWMRAGTYGWRAAEKGFAFICWTNTIPNLPPWGAKEAKSGNNPIVFAVPRTSGPVVLDIALSQYSYGVMSNYRREGKNLPFAGGYDTKGQLTCDASEILNTQRTLPIGLWKGAGMSLLLDLFSTILAQGNSTKIMGKTNNDSGSSKVFIAIKPSNNQLEKMIEDILEYYKSAEPIEENGNIVYPGERLLRTKLENLELGIPVDENVWREINSL